MSSQTICTGLKTPVLPGVEQINSATTNETVIFAAVFIDHDSNRRSAGVVELARLESVYIRKGIKGSNPFSSAFARRSFCVGELRSKTRSRF